MALKHQYQNGHLGLWLNYLSSTVTQNESENEIERWRYE